MVFDWEWASELSVRVILTDSFDAAEGSSADMQESHSLPPTNVGSYKIELKLSVTELKKASAVKENHACFDFVEAKAEMLGSSEL